MNLLLVLQKQNVLVSVLSQGVMCRKTHPLAKGGEKDSSARENCVLILHLYQEQAFKRDQLKTLTANTEDHSK